MVVRIGGMRRVGGRTLMRNDCIRLAPCRESAVG